MFATHGNFLISTTIKVIGVFQPPSTLVTKDNHVRPLMSFRLIRVKIIAQLTNDFKRRSNIEGKGA